MSILTIVAYAISAHWAIVSTFVILGLFAATFRKINSVLERKLKRKKPTDKTSNIELCIVSKASNPVGQQLLDCITYHRREFQDILLNVIIDEGSDIEDEISRLHNGMIKVTVVPSKFSPLAIAKGRAIEYFIRQKVREDAWYAFIDDDNRVLGKDFLYEIPRYEKMGFTASNGILVPRSGGNDFMFVADALRTFDDLTIFRFGTGLIGKPLNGLHGEMMLVKGSALKEIGFDRKTITEDFAFARELYRNGHKSWQSDTRISIQSPTTARDFLKQRNRWFSGLWGDFNSAPLPMRLFVGLRLVDWKVGIIGSWMVFPLWFFLPIPWWISAYCAIGAMYYFIAYIKGVHDLGKQKAGLFRQFKCLVAIPYYSVLENLSSWIKPSDGFYVIDKRAR